MNDLTRDEAEAFAGWFQCLADPTRLQILNHVARAGAPVTVGDVVDAVGRSQSTVSRHLKVLADERYVIMEPDGVRTLIRVNDACMTELPAAAAKIMGAGESA